MPGPYDYSIQPAQSGMPAVLQGFEAALGIRQIQDARAQAEQQRLQQQQLNADLAEASRDPTKLPGLMVRYPQFAEKLSAGYKAMTSDQQRSELQRSSEVASALASGQPGMAVQVFKDHALALRNSGDEQGAKRAEALAQLAQDHPDVAFNGAMATIASLGEDGKRAFDGLLKLRTRPADERTATANADAAESDAATKAVAAKYAEPMSIADLKQKAAALGLTAAQTNQAIALTRKYGAETQQALLSLAGGGALGSPERVFDAEQKLRKEYTALTGDYTQVAEGYRKVKAAKDNAVGDVSLIYGYMKMLDPGSVVREGEYATASNAAGVPERVMNVYNRVMKGERLTPEQRTSFQAQAGETFKAAEKREQEARGGLEKVAKAYKLNPDNIFSARAQEAAPAAGPQAFDTEAAAQAAAASGKLKPGDRVTVGGVAGTWR